MGDNQILVMKVYRQYDCGIDDKQMSHSKATTVVGLTEEEHQLALFIVHVQ